MTTGDLQAMGFTSWGKFSVRTKQDLLPRIPSKFGVYVIRATRTTKRLVGESDIIYIGSACNQNGLKGRIRQYFSPGPTQITDKRIITRVGESDDYALGWLELATKSEAVGLEQRLLEKFIEDHGERPPENLKG